MDLPKHNADCHQALPPPAAPQPQPVVGSPATQQSVQDGKNISHTSKAQDNQSNNVQNQVQQCPPSLAQQKAANPLSGRIKFGHPNEGDSPNTVGYLNVRQNNSKSEVVELSITVNDPPPNVSSQFCDILLLVCIIQVVKMKFFIYCKCYSIYFVNRNSL